MKRIAGIVSMAILVGMTVPLSAASQPDVVPEHPERIMRYATQLPVGSRIQVRLIDGARFKGVLMGIEGNSLLVKPRTRVPEPERLVPFDTIESIEPLREGTSGLKAALIGAASGAAAFFSLVVLAFAALGE